MADHWRDVYRHPQDPATSAFAITAGPDEFAQPTRGLHASTDGDVTVTFVDGTTVTLTLKAGMLYPYRIKKCTAATATVVGVY
jgi:hypothetical protein